MIFESTTGLVLDYHTDDFDYIIMWAQAFGNIYGQHNQIFLLRECWRTLRPAGYFSFSGHDRKYVKAVYPQYTEGKKFYPYADTKCYWEVFTQYELSDLMKKAGFRVVGCCNSVELGGEIGKQVLVCVGQKLG